MERDPKDYLKLLDDLDFNSHAHVERDSLLLASTQIPCHFNSHAHVERDIVKCKFRKVFSISTHTLTWSVTLWTLQHFMMNRYFNSHAHVERDVSTVEQNEIRQDFNSHAHVERDSSSP